MTNEKKLIETKDDEINIKCLFERVHKPDSFRVHEILRVTVPVMAKIQQAQTEANEPLSYNVKNAMLWLCNKADISINMDELDSRPLEQRKKSKEKANADTSFKLTRELTPQEKTLIDKIKECLVSGMTQKKVLSSLKEANYSTELAQFFYNEAIKKEESTNPFL